MFIALSGMFNLRTITFDAPTIVSHHAYPIYPHNDLLQPSNIGEIAHLACY